MELLEHKKAVKELDQKRRAAEQQEAERRRQKQLQMLYEDPVVYSILPPVAEYTPAASVGSGPLRVSRPATVEPPAVPSQPSQVAADVRASYDTAVIQQVASQFQLHAQPDNELLLMHKRPRVPRLSKSFVNRNSLVYSNTEGRDEAAVTLTKREKTVKATQHSDSDGESDGYGDDADFESKDGQKDASAANSQLVQKVLQNDRYGKHSRGGKAASDQEAEDSDFESHAPLPSATVDIITERSEAVLQKRREDGRQYAEKRMVVILQKEEEARRLKALEEQKRRESLNQLKQRVLGINKRTKHYSSASQASNAQSVNSANSTGTPGGSSIRPMLSNPDDRPVYGEPFGDARARSISPHMEELLLNKYDYLPRQMMDAEQEDTVNIDDSHSNNDEEVPPPKHVYIQESGDKNVRDLQDLDPSVVGGWNRVMELEKARAALQKEQGLDATPPRGLTVGRPASAPSSSQSRNHNSPPTARPGMSASNAGAGTLGAVPVSTSATSQPRKPTPPPFRFNSWQAQQTVPVKKHTADAVVSEVKAAPRSKTASAAAGQSRLSKTGPQADRRKPSSKHHSANSHAEQNYRAEPGRSSSAPRRGERRPTARSSSAGVRRSAAGRYDDAEDAPRHRHQQQGQSQRDRFARSGGRSRSVFDNGSQDLDQDRMGGDMLDLMERDRLSDDEQGYTERVYDEDRDYDEDFSDAPRASRAAHAPVAAPPGGPALGGYLSMSPARDFLAQQNQAAPQPLYRPSPAAAAVLQEVSHHRGRAEHYGNEEQKLMEDVSLQAIQNFEQVNRVLQDVDRWCERAKHETLELQERLRMRESTESVVGHAARQSVPYVASPPDEKGIALLRRSLADKLSVNAPGLFVEADSSRSGSSGDSRDEQHDHSGFGSEDSPRQSDDQCTSHAPTNRLFAPQTASQSRNFDNYSAPSEERKASSFEDTEDNVLIGETDESGAEDEVNASGDGDELPALHFVPPVPTARADPPSAMDMFLLNTNRPDRPIVWAPRDAPQRSAEALSRDPLLAQQLGMTADRNDILAKYSKLDTTTTGDADTADFPTYRAPFSTEDWTKPIASSTTQRKTDNRDLPPYMPSLRNVGELAGLLRSTYKVDLSTEVGRRAMLDDDASDSESAGESSSDTDGGDYDNFSAVSIQAARMMRAQAEQLKAKEQALIARSSVDLSSSRTTSASEGVAAPCTTSAGPTATKDDSFNWDDLATRPLKFDVNAPTRLSVGDGDIPTDEMLHDYIMNARYGTELESPTSEHEQETTDFPHVARSATQHSENAGIAAGPQKVRYTGAELRMRMMDELRKQDELLNYTIELAELEKANSLQSARDLAMQAQQRTAQELAKLHQQKELDMQRLAYENSLALSLVNAQAQMDKHAADQREQMIHMQSQLGVQEMFRQYQELLHQADHVAGSLEHNQKLLQLEKMLHEDKAREAVALLESQHATERAALVMAHAEAQQAQASALAAATRLSLERRDNRMQYVSPRSSRDRAPTAPATKHVQDSYDEDYDDEYSTQFENEASMSMRSRSAVPVKRADLSGSDSIPEDVSSEPHGNHSLSISDSIMYSPDRSVRQTHRTGAQSKFDSSRGSDLHESIRSSASSVKHGGRYGKQAESEGSDIEEVEDAVEREIEASQESVFESYDDKSSRPSPPRKTAAEILRASRQQQMAHSQSSIQSQSMSQSHSQSYSQSARDLEISERSASLAQHRQTSAKDGRLQMSSRSDFEVSDEVEDEVQSVAEEIDEEAGEEYSDNFEFSDSKGSKSTSSSSHQAPARGATLRSTVPSRIAPAASTSVPASNNPRATIAALDSSTERDPLFADGGNVAAVLDEYREEMEQRLRAQEKTYKLKVQFLKAKQVQRLEWLDKVKQNKQISPADIQDEALRINDTYAEERAEVERERWALNARAYKELRKFKHLRKDLLNYQVNMQNSVQAAAELEASLLNLKKKESALHSSTKASDWYRQSKAVLGDSTGDSVTSSSDGQAFTRKLDSIGFASSRHQAPATQPARAQHVKAAGQTARRTAVAAEQNCEVEDEDDVYGADEFEKTFSTAPSPGKATAASKYELSQSEAYESETFEKLLEKSHAASVESVRRSLGRSQESSASEVASESDKSFNDSIEEEGSGERSTDVFRSQQQSHHSDHRLRSESDDAVEFGEAAYEDEGFEDTGAIDSTQHSTHFTEPASAAKPAATAAAAARSPESAASPEDEYSSYGDDEFASDHSRGSKGSSKGAVAIEPTPTIAVKAAPAADERSTASDDIAEEIDDEDEVPDHASESDHSEVYKGEQSQDSQREESQREDSPAPAGADVSNNFSHQEDDRSQESSHLEAADSPAKHGTVDQHTASSSFYSTGSVGASAKEEEDEVVYGDEVFDDYQSDYESEKESSPSPTALSPQRAGAQEREDAREESDSIGTDISEDDELAASFALQASAGSGSDDDYVKTSQAQAAAVGVASLAGAVKAEPVGAPAVAEPLAVETTQAEFAQDAITPMSSGVEQRDLVHSREDAEMELWGSEDFVESPAVFNRKTSELMLHQSSSESMSQPADTEDNRKMFFDPDQQRWVGGDEVSLDGFDESVDLATDNDKDLSSSLPTSVTNQSHQHSSADSSIADRGEFSRDASFEKEGIAERHMMGQSTDSYEEAQQEFEGEGELHLSRSESGPHPASPVRTTAEVAFPLQQAAATTAQRDQGDDDGYGSDEFSVVEVIHEDIEEPEQASPTKPPIGVRADNTKGGAELNNLTSLSAVSTMDESDLDTSELLAADLLDTLDALDKPAGMLEHQLSEHDTMNGSLSGHSFDYVEPARSTAREAPLSPVPSPVEESFEETPTPSPVKPVVGATQAASKPDVKVLVEDDSFLDMADFDLDEPVDGAEEVTSQATEFADLSEMDTDYIEDIWKAPTASVTRTAVPAKAPPAPESSDQLLAEQKAKEQEQRLVLVDDVTDTILDALVESECARVASMIPTQKGLPAKFTTAPTKATPVATKPSPEKSAQKEPDVDLEFTADLLAETMMRKSPKFGHKEHAHHIEAEPELAHLKHHLPSSKSTVSSLSSLSALPSLSAKKAPLPSLQESKHEQQGQEWDDEHGDSSLMLPAEFDDEELYEFDIPTNKPATNAAPLTPHVSAADSEESQAGAALAASIVAAEAAKGRSQRMLAETKVSSPAQTYTLCIVCKPTYLWHVRRVFLLTAVF